jgi:hypothetical protein
MNPKKSATKRSSKKLVGTKAHITKILKQMYPVRSKYDDRTYNDFTASEVRKAEKYYENKKSDKQKRKDTWTKIQIIRYFDKIGKNHSYEKASDVPESVFKKYSKDSDFLNFKKRQGHILVFKKLKERWPESNRELDNFIELQKEERKKPRKKRNKSPRYYKSEL